MSNCEWLRRTEPRGNVAQYTTFTSERGGPEEVNGYRVYNLVQNTRNAITYLTLMLTFDFDVGFFTMK